MTALDPFGKDVVHRCRWAIDHNDGHPLWAWSTGERLAVALVMYDHDHLRSMSYTPTEAAQRVVGGMAQPPADFAAWLAAIRKELDSNDQKGILR